MTQDMKNLRPIPWLVATGLRGIFLGQGRPEGQAVMDGDGDQCDQGNRDHRMHHQHQPMPRGRVRALRLALDQDTVFVFFADDLGQRLSRMISDRGLARIESRPVG